MGSASRAEMWVQPVLSVTSSKRPSGVAAELERLLGDAAMAVGRIGATRPGHATKQGRCSHAGHCPILLSSVPPSAVDFIVALIPQVLNPLVVRMKLGIGSTEFRAALGPNDWWDGKETWPAQGPFGCSHRHRTD